MENKIVLITGCSSGIGKALAEEFHRRHFHVIATARRVETLADLRDKGITTYSLDVTHSHAIDEAIAAIESETGRIDMLINNAGYGLIGPAIEIPEHELTLQLQTNVVAPLMLAQKVAPLMRRQHSGLILNMGSVSGLVTTPFSGAYCASKAALHALSDALRLELEPFGIRVVTVQAGAVRSRFGQTAGQVVSRLLSPESWYQSVEDSIRMRAQISQVDATSAEDFAQQLVSIVTTQSPPAIVKLGQKSRRLPFLKQLMPTRIFDQILRRRFGLTQAKLTANDQQPD